ncbi:MAG: protein kinase [Verrucomicrobia bacterium]|nr:protein kinase [Verrucomicrobiota bacterium]
MGPSLLPIPGHTVLEEIARGGMGIVYRARQLDPHRTVALKMLLPAQTASAEMRERFRLETRAIASLEHEAILPVYQVGEHQGLPYFTMKFASGGTLAARRDQYRGQFRRMAELMVQLADAVQFAHERGVIHRDLKPGNILFDEAGRPYVSDFGLAKFMGTDDGLTRSIHLLGTPHYLAPEVAARCARFATTASDIYSLGAILYELLSGRPPFAAESVPALLKQIAEEQPMPPSAAASECQGVRPEAKAAPEHRPARPQEPNGVSSVARPPPHLSGIPRDLEVICLKCLAKEPSRRYGSARELAEDLQRWLDGNTILARPVSRTERAWRWTRRNPLVSLLTVLLGLALAGGGLIVLRSNFHLDQALRGTRAALQETLLMQARLERTSGRTGHRAASLALIAQATVLLPESRKPADSRRLALRSEVAGSLALPDLRLLARWPVPIGSRGFALDFTPDLERYAASASEGGFNILATTDHRVLRHFGGASNNPPVGFKFSRDCRWLTATFQDGHAEVHALESEQPPVVFSGKRSAHTEVEFVPGPPCVLVAAPQQGAVRCHLEDGASRELIAAPATVLGLAADAQGNRFACFAGGAVQVLRVEDGARVWSMPFTNGTPRFAWSPDGRQLAVAESLRPYETTVFELDSGRIVAHFQDHELSVSQMAFHPDGRSLASVGLDNRLAWRQVGHSGWRLTGQAGQGVLRFSADGQRLACELGWPEVGVLEVLPSPVFHQWRRTSPPHAEACMIAVSPDGRLVATSTAHAVHLWDAAARLEISHLPFGRRLEFATVHFHPDGHSLLYSAVGFGVWQVELKANEHGAPDRSIAEFGAARQLSPGPDFLLEGFAPDARSPIVLAQREPAHPVVWLWPDGDAGRARQLTDGFPTTTYHLTANGRWGLTAHWSEPDVWLWDPQTARRVRSLGIPVSAVASPSPDGRWLLVTTSDQHQLWEVDPRKPGPAWPHPLPRGNWARAFSLDGRWLATAGLEGQVEIRSLPGAELVLELPPPHPVRLHDLAFSPNRARLFLLQGTDRLLEWDLAELRRELARRSLDWKD